MPSLAKEVITLSGGCDPAVAANAQRITTELRREEKKFGSTLEAGTGSACTVQHLLLLQATQKPLCRSQPSRWTPQLKEQSQLTRELMSHYSFVASRVDPNTYLKAAGKLDIMKYESSWCCRTEEARCSA